VKAEGWQGNKFGAVSDAEEEQELRWEAQEEYAKHPAAPLEINPLVQSSIVTWLLLILEQNLMEQQLLVGDCRQKIGRCFS
jgi:hypothetical protein